MSMTIGEAAARSGIPATTIRCYERIDRMLAEPQSLRAALADPVERRNGDHRPECPIIDDQPEVAAA